MYIPENIISIFIGIISGIITSIILGVVSKFFKRVILPWFQKFVYSGVNVSGNWIYSIEESISATEKRNIEISLDLTQNAHEISGHFRSKNNYTDKQEYINYYNLKGLVKDNFLLFSYSAQRSDRTGIGSFLLRVAKGGTQLIGSAVYVADASPDDHEVTERRNMIFKRK
ncbi:MAG TPA: hypothetical protein VEC13_00180 [Candidatus Paceibacterota bacterium]|nr:hypothetical protein [Candidatus Paceibacterota bacterium]